MTKERPILFNAAMVRAILEGRKTQTRRVVSRRDLPLVQAVLEANGKWVWETTVGELTTPYGQPGDRLWVREAHAWADKLVDGLVREDAVCVAYRADETILRHEGKPPINISDRTWNLGHASIKWRPSIHMPRWASRITLEIVSVRVERLQEITAQDAEAEGIDDGYLVRAKMPSDAKCYCYRLLWDSLNAKRGYGWDVNPYVWVILFKRHLSENPS